MQFHNCLRIFVSAFHFFLTLTKDGTNILLYPGIEPRKLAERNLCWPAGTAIGPSADFWSYLKSSLEAFLSRVVFPISWFVLEWSESIPRLDFLDFDGIFSVSVRPQKLAPLTIFGNFPEWKWAKKQKALFSLLPLGQGLRSANCRASELIISPYQIRLVFLVEIRNSKLLSNSILIYDLLIPTGLYVCKVWFLSKDAW